MASTGRCNTRLSPGWSRLLSAFRVQVLSRTLSMFARSSIQRNCVGSPGKFIRRRSDALVFADASPHRPECLREDRAAQREPGRPSRPRRAKRQTRQGSPSNGGRGEFRRRSRLSRGSVGLELRSFRRRRLAELRARRRKTSPESSATLASASASLFCSRRTCSIAKYRSCASELRGALVQRLQIRAFHFVAALHLADEQLGIAADAQRGDAVAGRVIERGEQRVIFGDVVGFAADLLGQLQDDSSLRVADDHGVGRRAGIAARGAVDIREVNAGGGPDGSPRTEGASRGRNSRRAVIAFQPPGAANLCDSNHPWYRRLGHLHSTILRRGRSLSAVKESFHSCPGEVQPEGRDRWPRRRDSLHGDRWRRTLGLRSVRRLPTGRCNR